MTEVIEIDGTTIINISNPTKAEIALIQRARSLQDLNNPLWENFKTSETKKGEKTNLSEKTGE